MEYIDFAGAGGAVVSLLATWKALREKRNEQGVREFVDWLREHRFDEMVDHVAENSALVASLAEQIERNQSELMGAIQQVLVAVGAVQDRDDAGAEPLGRHAVELLKAVRDKPSGRLSLSRPLRSGRQIAADPFVVSEVATGKREFARYYDALRHLERIGYLEDSSGNDTVFMLMSPGYDYLDRLEKEENEC